MQISGNEQDPYEGKAAAQATGQPTVGAGHSGPSSLTWIGTRTSALILLLVCGLGLGAGYLLWGRVLVTPPTAGSEGSALPSAGDTAVQKVSKPTEQVSLAGPVSLPESYNMPVSFRDIGPQLLAAGAIDYDRFVQVYKQAGQPLTEEQLDILKKGSGAPIVIDRDNAYFALNFFWALGLTNQNRILEEGAMMQYGEDQVGRFASTGGWTIGAKPATALYASTPILTLTPEQQTRLEEVASAVYRPCCNNPTSFPDCNHGMAMLGLLELMASQDASVDEMFTAAKYANAFWFPQQTVELAVFFKASRALDFAEVEARELVGAEVSSGSGFRTVHQWLAENKLLDQVPGGGSSCAV